MLFDISYRRQFFKSALVLCFGFGLELWCQWHQQQQQHHHHYWYIDIDISTKKCVNVSGFRDGREVCRASNSRSWKLNYSARKSCGKTIFSVLRLHMSSGCDLTSDNRRLYIIVLSQYSDCWSDVRKDDIRPLSPAMPDGSSLTRPNLQWSAWK